MNIDCNIKFIKSNHYYRSRIILQNEVYSIHEIHIILCQVRILICLQFESLDDTNFDRPEATNLISHVGRS